MADHFWPAFESIRMSTPASPAGKSIQVRSSRIWALFTGRFTEFLFPLSFRPILSASAS
jgi:hypothetical protein